MKAPSLYVVLYTGNSISDFSGKVHLGEISHVIKLFCKIQLTKRFAMLLCQWELWEFCESLKQKLH